MAVTVRLDRLLAGVAVALLAFGLGVALVPGAAAALPAPLAGLDDWIPQATLDHVLGALLGCYVVWRLLRGRTRSSGERPAAEDRAPASPPRRDSGDADPFEGGRGISTGDPGSAARGRVVGEEYTNQYGSRLENLRSSGGASQPAPLPAFRDVAVAVEHARGADPERASERVVQGEWTDDPLAAAFVGGPEAGRVPLRRRLAGLLSPSRAFEHRVERTLAALDRAAASLGSAASHRDASSRRDSSSHRDASSSDATTGDDASHAGRDDVSHGGRDDAAGAGHAVRDAASDGGRDEDAGGDSAREV